MLTHRTHQAPTLDAGLTGANAASGRCADFIRPPSSGESSADAAPAVPPPIDDGPGAPVSLDWWCGVLLWIREHVGTPSAEHCAEYVAARGFDLVAGEHAFQVAYARDIVETMEAVVQFVWSEGEAAQQAATSGDAKLLSVSQVYLRDSSNKALRAVLADLYEAEAKSGGSAALTIAGMVLGLSRDGATTEDQDRELWLIGVSDVVRDLAHLREDWSDLDYLSACADVSRRLIAALSAVPR